MRYIDDPDILLYPAAQAAINLGLSRMELVTQVGKLKVDFWIEPPKELTIFSVITQNLNGHPIHSPPIHSNVFLTPSFPALKKLVCVTAIEAKKVVQLHSIEKNEFERAAIFSEHQQKFITISPKDFYRCSSQAAQQQAMHRLPFDFCDYDTAETRFGMPTDTEMESTAFRIQANQLTIRFDDLRLGREALQQLMAAAVPEDIDYGQFVPGPWTSSKLADLNEASTRFFGSEGERPAPPSDDKKEQIRNWFRSKWPNNTSKDLFDQALLAIIPDEYYARAPFADQVDQAILEQNNPYASRTLMLINKAAAEFYQKEQDSSKPWKSTTAVSELQSFYGLHAKMAAQAAIIICPDNRSRTLHHRKP